MRDGEGRWAWGHGTLTVLARVWCGQGYPGPPHSRRWYQHLPRYTQGVLTALFYGSQSQGALRRATAASSCHPYALLTTPALSLFPPPHSQGKLGKLQISVHKSNHFILHYLAEALVDSSLTKLILRNLMAKGVTLGLQQLDVALMQLRLNPAEPDDRKRMVRLKQQASELRDLMVKLRERAGTLEIDFLDVDEEGKPIEGGRSRLKQWQEETHVLRWVKGQVQRTGTREVVRDRWRSNVFDLDDGQPVDVPASAPNVRKAEQRRDEVIAAGGGEAPAAAAPTSGEKPSAEETQQEAVAHSKPQGPTTQATVEDAAVTLEKQKVSHWSWFSRRSRRVKGKEGKTETKSKVGKEAEKEGLSLKEQTDVLEKRVESRGREEAAAAAQ